MQRKPKEVLLNKKNSISKRQVLIVEDDASLRNLIEKTLAREGYETKVASCGAQAIAYLKERPESVLLLDHRLPDMNSIELIEGLKSFAIEIPFIVMTGQGDERLAVQLMKLGAYDYLVKGLDFLPHLQSTFSRLYRELETEKRLKDAEEAASLAEQRLHDQYKLSISLSKARTLDETLNLSLEAAIKTTALDAGGIYLFDDGKSHYYLAAHRGFSQKFSEHISIYDPSTRPTNNLSHTPLYTNYEESNSMLDPIRKAERLRALARVPIPFEEEIIAFFVMASHALDQVPIADRITLEAIAAQIGSYITRIRAEESLQSRERKYRAIFESIHDAIFVINREGTFLECNDQAVALFGLERKEDLLQRNPTDFSPITQPDGQSSKEASSYYIKKALETQENIFFQWAHRRNNGEIFLAEIILTAYPMGGEMLLQSTVRDVTPRLRAEQALKEREEQFRMVLDTFPDGIIVLHSPDFSYQFAGGKGLSDIGFQKEDLLGKKPRDIFAPEFCDALEEHISQAFQGKKSTFEIQLLNHYFYETVLPFYKEGEIVAVMGVINIITQQKKAEEKLRQSENRFRQIVESSPLPLSISDANDTYEYLNPKFIEVFGYTLADIPTRERWFELAYPDPIYRAYALGTYKDDTLRIIEDDIPRHFRVRCKDGSVKEIMFRLVTMDNSKRLIIYEDITERLKAESMMKERNKELGALYDLSIHMRTAKNSAQLLPMVLEKTQSLLVSHGGMIILLSPKEDHFYVEVAQGEWRENDCLSFPIDKGIGSIVHKTHQPYVTADYDSEGSALPFKDIEPMGPSVFVPLLSEEALLGLLVIGRKKGQESSPFSPTEVTLLKAIGEMAGNALRRQQLFDREQKRMRQLRALRKIDMAITKNQDLSSTLHITLNQITEMLEIDGTAILRLNKDKTLQYLAWRGFKSHPAERLNRKEPTLSYPFWDYSTFKHGPYIIPDLSSASLEHRGNLFMKREGFVAYGAAPLVARDQMQGFLEVFHRKPLQPERDWLKFMETLAGQVAIAIDNHSLYTSLELANMELTLAYDATIEGWAYALDLRDKDTEGHSQRVTELTMKLALGLQFPKEQLLHIRRGAILHDIGKMGIPDSILLKPGKLTKEEWEIMRLHPQFAREMLYPIEYLRPALTIPYYHHEKWDGSGYPRGLKGEEIPLEARIFAIVDVYDALTSDRPYRLAWTKEKTLDLIDSERNKHFDPEIVDRFLKEKEADLKRDA